MGVLPSKDGVSGMKTCIRVLLVFASLFVAFLATWHAESFTGDGGVRYTQRFAPDVQAIESASSVFSSCFFEG